jgi:hypothetical protein
MMNKMENLKMKYHLIHKDKSNTKNNYHKMMISSTIKKVLKTKSLKMKMN